MPADIENMVLTRAPAWHGWPVLQEQALTFDEVLANVPQLGAEVRPTELMWLGSKGRQARIRLAHALADGHQDTALEAATALLDELREVDGHVANVRASFTTPEGEEQPEKLVGVVTDSYKVAQTRHQGAMLDELVGSGELRYETALSLDGGKRHAILARLPEDVEVAGDMVNPYIFAANSFDGSLALTWAVTPVRIVCSNTLRWALQDSEARGSIYRVPHIGSIQERIQQAQQALGFTKAYLRSMRVMGERFAELKLTEGKIDSVLKAAIPMPTADELKTAGGANKAMSVNEKRTVIRAILDTAPDLAAHKGNGWGLFNAAVEYEDHYRQSKGEKGPERRLQRITLGERGVIEPVARELTKLVAA